MKDIKFLGTMKEVFESPNEFVAKNGNYYNCIYAWILEGEICYVGLARDLIGRYTVNGAFSHHGCYLDAKKQVEETGSHKGITIKYNGLLKYGLENVSVGIIVSDLETSNLAPQEIHYIAKYHTFYGDPEAATHAWNCNRGGQDASQLNTDDVIRRRNLTNSERMKKLFEDPIERQKILDQINNLSPEKEDLKRKKISDALTGCTLPDETRQAMSDSHTGVPLSEEHRQSIRDALKEHYKDQNERKRLSDAGYKRYEDPEEHKKTSDSLRAPEVHKRLVNSALRRWSDPSQCKAQADRVKGKICIHKPESHERYIIKPEEFWYWEDMGFKEGRGPNKW